MQFWNIYEYSNCNVPLFGQDHIIFLLLLVFSPLKWVKSRPVHISCLCQNTCTFLFSFFETVCYYIKVSVQLQKKKSYPYIYLFAAFDCSEMWSYSQIFLFRRIIWGLLKAYSQTWFSKVSSGNALVDNTHSSWTFWRVPRVWVPWERWNVAVGDFIILHLPHLSVLSDLEFHIGPFVSCGFFFFLMLNPCGWIIKIWLEKMQIYWAFTCQMRRFLGNWEGDPEFKFFSPALLTVRENAQLLLAMLLEVKRGGEILFSSLSPAIQSPAWAFHFLNTSQKPKLLSQLIPENTA